MSSATNEAWTTIEQALGTARRSQIIGGVVSLASSSVILLGVDETAPEGNLPFYVFACFFGALAALFFWIATVKSSAARSPLMHALRNTPSDIAWVYEQEIEVVVDDAFKAPVRQKNVIVKLRDGNAIALTIAIDFAPKVVAALAQLAPNAAFGYDVRRHARYQRNPKADLRIAA